MAWFKKKHDPVSEKARALEQQIQALENQIQKLSEAASQPPPKFRSSALPGGRSELAPAREEQFEEVDLSQLQQAAEPPAREPVELGVRKSDLPRLWRRLKNHLKPPETSNPKLVNYLAAGSIQGLRPLRYEKRVARNRFIVLVVVLLLLLWGILAVMFRR